ncbi:MAG TPA: DegV family protein, partial [Rhodanobacteraceae bacterium]
MRIGLVMDASCDLPEAFVREHDITVLPIRVDVDGQTFADRRDNAETQRFLDQELGARSHAASTEPLEPEAVEALFLDSLVTRYDGVFCLTITATRSPINANVNKANAGILTHYRAAREKAGLSGPFLLRVIDTQSLFTGSAVVVAEAVRLIERDLPSAQIREQLTDLSHNAYGYLMPRDLHYLRSRARKKGDRSIGMFGAALGSALDIKPILRGWRGQTSPVAKLHGFESGAQALFKHVVGRIRAGLLTPTVTL